MTSQAERRRQKKARTTAVAIENQTRRARPGAAAGLAKPKVIAPKAKYQRRVTPLEHLRSRDKITRRQQLAGEKYGVIYRAAVIEDPVSIRSCLAETNGGGFVGGGTPSATALASAEWLAEAKAQYAAAQVALGYHPAMVAACDVICGQQLAPGEVTKIQREAEEIETALRIALDLLASHYEI